MRVLITGGAGFIGSHVADLLIENGHDIAVIDDLSTGKIENLNPRAVFYQMKIQSPEVEHVMRDFKPEIIDHHAAHIDLRRSVIDPALDADINIMGSLNLLNQAVKYGIKKFIFASTGGAIYGEPEAIPVAEDADPKPLSPYGANKLTVEHYLRIWKILHGLDYTVLRYPNVYGPRQDPKGEAGVVAIFSLLMLSGDQPVIFGDGSKTRDYVFVEDIARANLLALDRGCCEVVNLGWTREISDLDVFNSVAQAVGVNIQPVFDHVRPGEVLRIALDTKRAAARLNWHPQVDFKTGTERSVEYYRKKISK